MTAMISADFYPRSPRGERRASNPSFSDYSYDFYPRSPRGERRDHRIRREYSLVISIHAPREGSDQQPRSVALRPWYFYPRSPRGERPGFLTGSFTFLQIFLSTLPARGATYKGSEAYRKAVISIHAPREGSDPIGHLPNKSLMVISIHAPREGSDLQFRYFKATFYKFLSTLPARGATAACSCSAR